MAYHSSLISGQGKVTEKSLESEMKKEFNKSTLDEGWLDKTSVSGKWKITIDNVFLELPAGISDDVSSVINYGDKTAQTVEQGDDITIGTERFKVLKNENNIITALSYYNLYGTYDYESQRYIEMIQNPDCPGGNLGYAFVTEEHNYSSFVVPWEAGEDLNMSDPTIRIEMFIEGYQETLETLGATNVTARIARYQEMFDLTSDTESSILRNPSQSGYFWLGTSDSENAKKIYIVNSERKF